MCACGTRRECASVRDRASSCDIRGAAQGQDTCVKVQLLLYVQEEEEGIVVWLCDVDEERGVMERRK